MIEIAATQGWEAVTLFGSDAKGCAPLTSSSIDARYLHIAASSEDLAADEGRRPTYKAEATTAFIFYETACSDISGVGAWVVSANPQPSSALSLPAEAQHVACKSEAAYLPEKSSTQFYRLPTRATWKVNGCNASNAEEGGAGNANLPTSVQIAALRGDDLNVEFEGGVGTGTAAAAAAAEPPCERAALFPGTFNFLKNEHNLRPIYSRVGDGAGGDEENIYYLYE